MIDARTFGATGDGATDDTDAIQRALEEAGGGGAVYLPPGRYRTRTLKVPSSVSLLGYSGWGYRQNGSTSLVPAAEDQTCLLDCREAFGVRIAGLTLDGEKKGAAMHGIVSKHGGVEQHIAVEDCRIVHCTGSGIRLDNAWVWAVRRCLLMYNGQDGIDADGSYDGWVIDNQLAANGRFGIGGSSACSLTLTANRVEWNAAAGMSFGDAYVSDIQIANCYFDRNWGPGLEIKGNTRCTTVAVTGNQFRNNGFRRPAGDQENCHVLLRGIHGLAFTGNSLRGGTNNKGSEPCSPDYGIVAERLAYSTIVGNALYHAGMKEPFLNLGGHVEIELGHNPASKQEKHGMENSPIRG